jgi:hypothetical protein
MATRLVRMGAHLNGGPEPNTLTNADQWPGAQQKVDADLAFNDQRARTIGQVAATAIPAYERSLPDDGGDAEIVEQPGNVERFGAAFLSWNGGSNYTDDPKVRVQRLQGRAWTDYADQSGELPVTLRLPPPEELAAYRANDQRWHWTAHFEAFVSPFDTGERPRATPAGVYRFVVSGQRREGGAVKPYRLTSREFGVRQWTGVTVEDLRREPDDTVSFRVGPRHTFQVPEGNKNEDAPIVGGEIGPVDYPDSYKSKAPFIREERWAFRDRGDPSHLEWFCFTCSFRPWIDSGDATRATVTFVDTRGGVRREGARQRDDRWYTQRRLGDGEAAYVESGDACDRWSNYNARASATIGDAGATPRTPPSGFSCIAASRRAGGGGPGGFASASNPLGLPSPRTSCVDRRAWRFRINQPRRGRVVALNAYVNGRRVLAKRGRRVKAVKLRRLRHSSRYRLKVVAITSSGAKVIGTKTYRGCR